MPHPVGVVVCCLCCCAVAQAELADAHKGDPLEPVMSAEEHTETERVFRDF
jgi:hypothetical protein